MDSSNQRLMNRVMRTIFRIIGITFLMAFFAKAPLLVNSFRSLVNIFSMDCM